MSLFSKIIPKGIRKLTWKKVGKVLPFVAGAAALAIPGVGPVVAAGIGKAASVAGKVLTGGATIVGSVAKGVGSIAGAAGSAAGDISGRIGEASTDVQLGYSEVDAARLRIQADIEAADRTLRGQLPMQLPAFAQSPMGLALLVGGVIAVVLLIRRK